MPRGRKPIKFDANDKATNEWLNAFKKSTRINYAASWRKVLEFTGMSGDEMLADRRADKTGRWEKRVLQLKQWMKQKGASDLHARQITVTLRSFFSFHRCELEMTRQESSKLRQARRKTEDYKFSVADLNSMDAVGDTEEKYIVTVGKSFGLRVGDFIRLTRGHFDALDLEQKPPISLGEIITIKEGVPAYPFIDSDAITAVKDLLDKMNREDRTNAKERMLTYKHSSELSHVLRRLVKEAGVRHGDKRVRFHCLRKFLTDRLSDVMSESKWKQIVGKSISEDAYVTADKLREDYERAMADTTYKKPISESEIEMRGAQRMLEMALNMSPNIPEHVKETLLKKIRASKKLEDLKPIEIEVAEASKNNANNNCADGEHCQRIVSEAELGGLLAQGWRVAAVLPSGKIVVSNDA